MLRSASTYVNHSEVAVTTQGVLVCATRANALDYTLFSFGDNTVI